MSQAPKFYDVRLTNGPLVLCNACVAVLVQEGTVAGDPREEAVPASDVVRMAPRVVMPSDAEPTCDTCSSREAYEEALNGARAETCDAPLENFACADVSFGSPEEHARWHAIHDTPTLREVEGEDSACDGDGEAYCNPDGETYCPKHAEELRLFLESTPF